MSRNFSRPMRVPNSRASSAIGRRRSDNISRRIVAIGGALLAAAMLILSAQTSGAKSPREVTIEVASTATPAS
jgi:hypothetical protein